LGSVTPTTPLQLTEQFGRVHYGADYNPDQWPRDVWDDDIALMREAGLTVVSLPIFSWVHLQPAQDSWDFEWLDDILDRLHAGGIGFYLATATASVPAWIDQRYPSVLRTGPDGRRVRHGERHDVLPELAGLRPALDRARPPDRAALPRPPRAAAVARRQRVRPDLLVRPVRRPFPRLAARALPAAWTP